MFRAALETMLDSVVMTTAVRGDDGQIVDFVVDYINPVAEIGQRPAEHIVGQRFLDVWPSTTESPIWGMYLHLMETGEPIVLDNFVYRDVIDGEPVTAVFDIRATRLGDGFLQNFRDVTERYRTQQELAASEMRFRSAVDAVMDPFFMFRPVRGDQGQIVELEYRYVNQAAMRLYQMPWQDIVGHGMLELFPSVREVGLWDTCIESIKTGTPARIDIPYFDEHGVQGSFDLAVTPSDEGIIADAREVSEARRVEEALRASEERFRTSVEALQDGFAIFSSVRDSAGAIADFRYEYINEAGCRMEPAVPGRDGRAHPHGAVPRDGAPPGSWLRTPEVVGDRRAARPGGRRLRGRPRARMGDPGFRPPDHQGRRRDRVLPGGTTPSADGQRRRWSARPLR